jgi:dTDP-4-amino-4,6-dideoxygalactose transaminase
MTRTSAELLVPFHRATIGEEEVLAVSEVLRSGWLTMGARTQEFERQFAKYVGAQHAVAVSSCTAALHLALEAIGLRPGDEVLLPATTFTATAEAVIYLGGRPVLVDIEPSTMNLDPEDAARRLTPRTRAILPVHMAGQPCDLAAIHTLAAEHGLRVIEDAAHALPATYRGQLVGSISEFTAFSFYATKTLTTGEGGMVTTSNAAAAERMRMMRLHGIARDAWKRYSAEGSWRYEVMEAGYKYNFTDLQAAIGLVQLSKCSAMLEARRRVAERYSAGLEGVEEIEIPAVQPDRKSAWHLFILRLRLDRLEIDRDQFIEELKERGIGSSVHFIPLHLHPFYQRKFSYRPGDFPKAEAEYRRCISLPIFPTMQEEEIDQVIVALTDIVQRTAKRRRTRRYASR